jgi:hypothetical protein
MYLDSPLDFGDQRSALRRREEMPSAMLASARRREGRVGARQQASPTVSTLLA